MLVMHRSAVHSKGVADIARLAVGGDPYSHNIGSHRDTKTLSEKL
jgi:hypothetical protein